MNPSNHQSTSLLSRTPPFLFGKELNIEELANEDITQVLPFLAKLLLNPAFIKRPQLLKLLYPIKRMNDTLQLLMSPAIEPHEFNSPQATTSFESSNHALKLRIVAFEYIRIQDQARQLNFSQNPSPKLLQSELFDNPLYVEDVAQCLCILLIKGTASPIMNILDMSEALLYLKYGPVYVVTLVANMPDRCQEVCQTLINFGERQDETAAFTEVSDQRTRTLGLICKVNPSIAFTVRSMTLQACKMPSLTVLITLNSLEEALNAFNSDESDRSVTEEVLGDGYDNAIAFITGILLGADENSRAWFAQYTKSAQLKRIDQSHYSILSGFRSIILAYMDQIFSILFQEDTLISLAKTKPKDLNKLLIRATATLRLFCALRGIGSLKLNTEESETLLKLITCRPFANQTSINFATTGVCTLLACPAVINSQKEERRAAEWLRWLIKESNYSHSSYSSHGRCSISELLLLIAIHFQNNQNSRIAELICTTLGMKLQIKASVSKCKSLFVQEVFNDQMVAEHAVKVPVTRALNDEITEFLPVHCIHQLLETRSFSKHQVPIKDWIYEQICESKRPLHSILPRLIEAYVNSVIISASAHGHCGTNNPMTEDQISRVFKIKLYSKTTTQRKSSNSDMGKEAATMNGNHRESSEVPMDVSDNDDSPRIVDVEASQILLLYYLLLYEDVRLKRNSELSAIERASLINYSADLMLEIPVFYILQLVRDNQNSFGVILPDLLKLVTSQYPQLCSTQHWLNLEHDPPLQIKNYEIKESLHQLLTDNYAKLEIDPLALAKTLSRITNLRREEIWPYIDIFIENLSRITRLKISDSIDYGELIQVTTKLWWKFNTVFPRKLWVMTVNALRRPQNLLRMAPEVKPLGYTWDELVVDPLIVLRCDSRVFRCVDTLEIILHILSAFLAASRRCIQDQINDQPIKHKDVRNLEELKNTLIFAQTSAAIQILLEFCLPNDEEQRLLNKRDDEPDMLDEEDLLLLDRFDSSVNCICEHLHQVFIADTNLAKLVHFQTYPSDLLATTSDKIPSMHICLDFIPELLSQPDLTKQIFVIELTSHLCEKYPITKSLNVAKLCFNVSYTLLQILPSERRALFFIPILPAMLRICKVFPILREDATAILHQINQITIAHMASTSSRLCLGSTRPFEGLESMKWRDVKKLMSTLSLHEALYLCIQKFSLDLTKLKETDERSQTPEQEQRHVYSSIFAYGTHVINPSGSL